VTCSGVLTGSDGSRVGVGAGLGGGDSRIGIEDVGEYGELGGVGLREVGLVEVTLRGGGLGKARSGHSSDS
jgi:hypothetical protein